MQSPGDATALATPKTMAPRSGHWPDGRGILLERASPSGSSTTPVAATDDDQPHGYQVPPVGVYPCMTASTDPTLMPKAARYLLHTAVEQGNTAGLDVTPVAGPGGAAHAILERAAEADLVVVGSRGCGTVERLRLGSVATQVAHHAPRPVAIIPSTER